MDEEVARVQVSMNELVLQDHPGHGVRHAGEHPLASALCILLPLRLLDELGERFAPGPGRHQQVGRVHDDAGHPHHPALDVPVEEVGPEPAEVGALDGEVGLLAQVLAEGVHRAAQRQPPQLGAQPLGGPGAQPQELHVGAQQMRHLGPQHLDHHVRRGRARAAPLLQLARVDLRDAPGAQEPAHPQARHRVRDAPPLPRLQGRARHLLVQPGHPLAQLLWQQVPPRGEPLRQLDEHRATGLQGRHHGAGGAGEALHRCPGGHGRPDGRKVADPAEEAAAAAERAGHQRREEGAEQPPPAAPLPAARRRAPGAVHDRTAAARRGDRGAVQT
mmetsp:Transcript_72712/g.189633  ORF Transcript_72712/g.189633 Transcript_72712/m.189633 type:complete len:331 (+) Transcript_72712:627-1619(+)